MYEANVCTADSESAGGYYFFFQGKTYYDHILLHLLFTVMIIAALYKVGKLNGAWNNIAHTLCIVLYLDSLNFGLLYSQCNNSTARLSFPAASY
jgi:hypothetical protein